MRGRSITTWLGIAATAAIFPVASGKKGFVALDKWESWLASPRGGNATIASPDAFLTRIGQSLADLFDKIERTYPLLVEPDQINLAGTLNRPPDLVALNLRIIEDLQVIREAEEGPDESEITETEGDEWGPGNLVGETGVFTSALLGNQANDNEGPLDTMVSWIDFHSEIRRQFREFEFQLQNIIDTEVELKDDIWSSRRGPPQRITAFTSLIEANRTINRHVPLNDNLALSLWVFNGNALSRDGDTVMLQYNTDARDDLRDAFNALQETFSYIDRSLFRWMVRLEESLSYPDRIEIVMGNVKALQDFSWAYKENCEELSELIEEGLNLPESWGGV
ncbi:hypothetical protein TWF696_002629 [Orbilia brochopaga]|uniref:Uncharacterized protein n=1 Tax=Orbilia brochopaga TaxID=3140254 RepID=A0AAV9U2V1_9PEZI